jgi:hypothetical protein
MMSHYTIDELIARWKNEELTAEQAIGQILLLLKEQERKRKETQQQPGGDANQRGRGAPG